MYIGDDGRIVVLGNLLGTGAVHGEELRIHQALVQKLSHIVDLIIDCIFFCLMVNFSVLVNIVSIADAVAESGNNILQGIYRTAPVFRSQRIYGVAVVIGKSAFFDLYQQVIELILCIDCGGIDAQLVHNPLLDVQTALILFLGDVLQRGIFSSNSHLPQIYAVQVITEYNVLIGIFRKISVFIVSGINLGILHVLGHIREHSFLRGFQKQRELRSGGVVQIRNNHIGNGAGSQLRCQHGFITVTRCISDIQFDTCQLCDFLHGRRAVEILRKRVSDIIHIRLHRNGTVSNPGIRFI